MFGLFASHVVYNPKWELPSRSTSLLGGAGLSQRCVPYGEVLACNLVHGTLDGLHDGDVLILQRVEALLALRLSHFAEVVIAVCQKLGKYIWSDLKHSQGTTRDMSLTCHFNNGQNINVTLRSPWVAFGYHSKACQGPILLRKYKFNWLSVRNMVSRQHQGVPRPSQEPRSQGTSGVFRQSYSTIQSGRHAPMSFKWCFSKTIQPAQVATLESSCGL